MSQTFPLRFNGLQNVPATPCDMDATNNGTAKTDFVTAPDP
jgi:hypothetical protein